MTPTCGGTVGEACRDLKSAIIPTLLESIRQDDYQRLRALPLAYSGSASSSNPLRDQMGQPGLPLFALSHLVSDGSCEGGAAREGILGVAQVSLGPEWSFTSDIRLRAGDWGLHNVLLPDPASVLSMRVHWHPTFSRPVFALSG